MKDYIKILLDNISWYTEKKLYEELKVSLSEDILDQDTVHNFLINKDLIELIRIIEDDINENNL